MSAKTYLKFYHKIDIYKRTEAVNDAGQKAVSFAKTTTIPAFFQANASERRLTPYVANIDEFQFYVSYQDNQYITYGNRIYNVRDRYGNVIESGPLEIINIEKKIGFGGRLHHLFLNTRRVVENG